MIQNEDNIFIRVGEFGEMLTGGVVEYTPLVAPLVAAGGVLFVSGRYRVRKRKEDRITGRGASMKEVVPQLKLKPGELAADKHPGMPAVKVRELTIENTIKRLKSRRGNWTLPTGPTDEPHILLIARSRHGKNETILDPMLWNCVFRRPDPVIVNDVKAAMYDRFSRRITRSQYRYTFDPKHHTSQSLNLIGSRRMAEITSAAIYRLGERGQIYGQTARAVFLALAEYLGYGKSSIVEIYRIASDRARLLELAKEVPALASILGGENRTFAGDVINSLIAPLEPLRDEQVSRVFSTSSEQPPLDKPVVVWIIIPQGLERVLGPLAGALLRNFYERAKVLSNPVRFLVDEAGSCLAFDDLSEFVAVGAGQSVFFALVLQSRSQLDAKIGQSPTNDVLNNCGYHWWGATGDPATRAYIEDMGGTAEVYRAKYEHHGWSRRWRQALTSEGAPYEWESRERSRIERQHTSTPKMWWYRYEGDPAEIELVIPPPLYTFEDQIMPPAKPGRRQIEAPKQRELPKPVAAVAAPRRPAADLPRVRVEDLGAGQNESRPHLPSHTPNFRPPTATLSNPEQGRKCEACEGIETDSSAVFCRRCSSRLPAQKG